jgi:S1-C subfamily serine protease
MGNFLQTAITLCGTALVQEVVSSLPLTAPMAGGGLFDADGNLLGVVLPCGDRLVAIAPPSVDAMLRVAATFEQRLLASYGLVVGVLSLDEVAHFNMAYGVIVREVWTGSAGDEAGFRPGDVIASLEGSPVAEPADIEPLMTPTRHGTFALGVRRHARSIDIVLPALGSAPLDAGSTLGLVLDTPPAGYRIDAVVPGSASAEAGLLPGDRLLRIDGADPRNSAQVTRLLADAAGRTAFLEVVRGDRRLGLLLSAPDRPADRP